MSRLEQLCMRSFVAHGHRVLLHVYDQPANVPNGVTLADAGKILPRERLFKHAESGSFAMFADGFRYRLLLEQGGLWVDTDMVCLKPFDFRDHGNLWVAGRAHHQQRGARLAEGTSARAMDERCVRAAESRAALDSVKMRRRKLLRQWLPNSRGRMTWGETGPNGLTAAAQHLHCTGAALPFWYFYPISYANWHTVFDSSLRDNPGLIAASYGLHLWNEMSRRSPGFDKNGRFPPDSLFEQLCARYL